MSRAYLFLGPSLAADALPGDERLVVLPPVARGDVARLIAERPRAIAIIDGCFETVPAVAHKEILHALAQGIAVLGGASMGALRAAELHGHGMRGVGAVFEAYAAGRLADDDEVAVLHGPKETGYRPLSVAMVDIRATLDLAVRRGVIDARTSGRLADLAKRRFYKERGYAALAADARAAGLDAGAFWAWCPANRVDLKAADALAVARAALLALDEPAARTRPFVTTAAYAALYASVGGGLTPDERAVLAELRLDPPRYARLRDRAILRALAPPGGDAGAVAPRLRDRLGFARGADEDAWALANAADALVLARIAADEAALDALRGDPPPGFARCLADAVRIEGLFGRLLARARDKQRRLGAEGLDDAGADDLGVSPAAALWRLVGDARPNDRDDDLDGWLRRQGFASRDDASRQALREHLYSRLSARDAGGENPANKDAP